jgi:dihydroxyacetone kinase-like predicted kinase
MNGFSIKEGDIIGLDNKKILAKSDSVSEAVIKLVAKMKEESHQVITLYYGENVTEEEAEAVCDSIRAKLGEDVDVSALPGGQPVYYYFLSME